MSTKLFFLLTVVFSITTPVVLNSQDTIIRKTGEIILCKIQNEDSATVSFNLKIQGREIKTYLNKSDILSFKYGVFHEKPPILIDKASFGIGLGYDLGGIGANLIIYPQKNIGLFAGAGDVTRILYNVGITFCVGVKIRLISEKAPNKITPFAIALYGYNTVIYESVSYSFKLFSPDKEYKKLFYGPTIGIGFDYRSKPINKSYWTLALLIPVRNNSEINRYINDLKTNTGIDAKNHFLPVSFSISYRFITN